VYDGSRRVTIEGTVAQFQLINPHPFLFIDVTDAKGQVQQWRLEMDNRFELVAIGVTATTFKPGDKVVVTGSLARVQPQGLYVWRLDRPADGFWYEQVGSSPRIANTR
jgi:NADPH:quinone reductase-like Zn-dependent oxidoreductase